MQYTKTIPKKYLTKCERSIKIRPVIFLSLTLYNLIHLIIEILYNSIITALKQNVAYENIL